MENYKTVIEAVEKTAQYIKSRRKSLKNEEIREKAARDFVTQVDIEAQKMLITEFKKIIPQAGFIAEEEDFKNSSNDYVFVIDPLDGTQNYIMQIPFISISVALLHKKKTIFGVVYDIANNIAYYAHNGVFYIDGVPHKSSYAKDIKMACICYGISRNEFNGKLAYLNTINDLSSKARAVRQLGSIALELAYTAAGKIDMFVKKGQISIWDFTAGKYLIESSGGIAIDFKGSSNLFEMSKSVEVIAGAPDLVNNTQLLFNNIGID